MEIPSSLSPQLLTLPSAPPHIFILPSSPAASTPSVHIRPPPPDPQPIVFDVLAFQRLFEVLLLVKWTVVGFVKFSSPTAEENRTFFLNLLIWLPLPTGTL